MAKAFDLLHNDLVFVTPYERAYMAKIGVRPHKGWYGSDHLEQHVLGAAHKIGVVLLPPLPDGADAPPAALLSQIQSAVLALRAKTRLVVVMSPWGYSMEQKLLNSAGTMPDVLLGSGIGIGLVGNIEAKGRTLWIRAFTQGKSMSRLDILDWPDHANDKFKWTEGQNIRMTLLGLTDQYQEDKHILSLMQAMGTD
ncbi:MAG: hypothetical protein KKF77_02370 [Proteobacteria bacterium]|nr:hypothetical protein [Pseudomonadota bacterium]